MSKPKVLILSTGGSISGRMSETGSISSGKFGAREFVRVLPEIAQIAEIETLELMAKDSVDMLPEDWVLLAQTIHANVGKYHGIVVAHGLDTMQYSASAVAFMLQELPIPVVFTGAQLPIHFVASDARQNLVAAVQVAATADIAEVCVVNGGLIHRAVRSRRIKAIETDAFVSLGIDPLGLIRHRVDLGGHQVRRDNRVPTLLTSFSNQVALITMHPGFDPRTLYLYLRHGYEAFLIVGFGLGYVPTNSHLSLIDTLQDISAQQVPVVVASQANYGHYETEFYEVGKPLKKSGAISARDMLWETALVKLMWLMGQKLGRDEVVKQLQKNLVHEMVF